MGRRFRRFVNAVASVTTACFGGRRWRRRNRVGPMVVEITVPDKVGDDQQVANKTADTVENHNSGIVTPVNSDTSVIVGDAVTSKTELTCSEEQLIVTAMEKIDVVPIIPLRASKPHIHLPTLEYGDELVKLMEWLEEYHDRHVVFKGVERGDDCTSVGSDVSEASDVEEEVKEN